MFARKLVLPALVLGMLGACADGSADDAGVEVSAEFAEADLTFVREMIRHHEQAIEMAELALAPGAEASADVTAFATRVADAQRSEIDLMTGWLTTWGEPLAGAHDMDAMDGMMSDADMEGLAQQAGEIFDITWLVMMIEHHQGALAMAETVQEEGTNPEVAALAAEISAAQQAEIEEMNGLLGS